MKLPQFEYAVPSTPEEAVALLASRPGAAKLIAGGQSLLPAMAFRLARPSLLVDLRRLHELRRITIGDSGVLLGARARWRDIEDDRRLATAHPLLAAAVRHVAHYPIRNRGTVGGSLAHADPAAEMPCIAVTCDARIDVLGADGKRSLEAGSFFDGPLSTVLTADDIILGVHLPTWPAARRWAFTEFSMRPGDFALAGIALYYDLATAGTIENAHVGVLGACHAPRRLTDVENALNGERPGIETHNHAARMASRAVDDVSDMHASAAYRRSLTGTLLERALGQATERSA